jgi:hypothetical protein
MSKSPSSLLEWFAERYNEFGTNLKFVINYSQEGAQFVKVFGAFGRLLRYKVDFTNMGSADDDEDEFLSGDDDIGQFYGLLRGASPGDNGRATLGRSEGCGWVNIEVLDQMEKSCKSRSLTSRRPSVEEMPTPL